MDEPLMPGVRRTDHCWQLLPGVSRDPEPMTEQRPTRGRVDAARIRIVADSIRKAIAYRMGVSKLSPLEDAADLPWLEGAAHNVLTALASADTDASAATVALAAVRPVLVAALAYADSTAEPTDTPHEDALLDAVNDCRAAVLRAVDDTKVSPAPLQDDPGRPAFQGGCCSNPRCPCARPGLPCDEYARTDETNDWCACCGWNEAAHGWPTEPDDPLGEDLPARLDAAAEALEKLSGNGGDEGRQAARHLRRAADWLNVSPRNSVRAAAAALARPSGGRGSRE